MLESVDEVVDAALEYESGQRRQMELEQIYPLRTFSLLYSIPMVHSFHPTILYGVLITFVSPPDNSAS